MIYRKTITTWVTQWLSPFLHSSAIKTLASIVASLFVVRRPIISRVAREAPEKAKDFKQILHRFWRFLNRSAFDVKDVWAAITTRMLSPQPGETSAAPLEVLMDWTDLGPRFIGLILSVPIRGRSLPVWGGAVLKSQLKDNQTGIELEVIDEFLDSLSPDLRARVVIVADRGFAKVELFERIRGRGAHFVIRLMGNHYVQIEGRWSPMRDLAPAAGGSGLWESVLYTRTQSYPVALAIHRCAQGQANDPEDDVWNLATDLDARLARSIYEKRFRCEETFRDLKDELHLDRHQIKSPHTLQKMLAAMALAYLWIVLDGFRLVNADRLKRVCGFRNGEPELSLFRQALAVLDRIAADRVALLFPQSQSDPSSA